jgi:hypothetical protein
LHVLLDPRWSRKKGSHGAQPHPKKPPRPRLNFSHFSPHAPGDPAL